MKPGYAFVVPWELDLAGGVNQVVANLYRQMLDAGELEPLIVVERWSAVRPVEEIVDGRRIVYLRMPSPWSERGSAIGMLKWLLTAPLSLARLRRFAGRYRVAAFNFHYVSLSALPVALLRMLRLYRGALILSFHGLDLRDARATPRIARALWKMLFRSSTAVVACSEAFARQVAEFAGTWPKRLSAVRNGLDVEYFVTHVDRDGALADGRLPTALADREFIVSVATLEHKKGHDVLLRAFARLRRGLPGEGLALVLVGRSDAAEPGLRVLTSELGLSRDVFFCTNVPHPQVGVFLERAKAFCLPSRAEPFGIALLEAGAYRLPVVASRVGGIPEIVIHGESGLLVQPDDVDGLAAALDRVMADPDAARGLGERLHRRVANEFPWKRAYEQYRTLATA